jgi:anti-anti-sigma regulatory factor
MSSRRHGPKKSSLARRVRPKGLRAAPPAPAAAAARNGASDAPVPLVIGPSLSIREAGACRQQLHALLMAGGTLVDVSALESIDTAGLQLLLAAAATAARAGCTLRLVGGRQLLQRAAAELGLAEPLAALAEIAA